VGPPFPQPALPAPILRRVRSGAAVLLVSVLQQRLWWFAGGAARANWPVSTAGNGVDAREGSGGTPPGLHRIAAKIGAGAPAGAVFVAREPTGEVLDPNRWTADAASERGDPITSRILWLAGMEPGVNHGAGVDSQARYIYIHGTPDTARLGKPVSRGCIRMSDTAVTELFDAVEVDCAVYILDPEEEQALDPGLWAMATRAIRGGYERTAEQEHGEAMFLTSSFVFDSAEQAAARFSGTEVGNLYGRFTNPTVQAFERRLALLEGGEAALATASGMAALLTLTLSRLRQGDRLLAARQLFGATVQWLGQWLPRYGIEVDWVDLTCARDWEQALGRPAQMVLVETPSNPLLELVDIRWLAGLCRQAGALLVVDNCLLSPALQCPLALGADLVLHSATKFLDGQGRVLGGAVVGAEAVIDPMRGFLRTAGPSLAPFNAWVLLKGLETLSLRVAHQSAQAQQLAQWLLEQPEVRSVRYPGLCSHPQHELATRQQGGGGALLSFEIHGGRAEAFRLLNAVRLLSLTANLGDVKSTLTHPASTTHGRLTPEQRAAAGIGEGLLRLSTGLEALADLKRDLRRGLDAIRDG